MGRAFLIADGLAVLVFVAFVVVTRGALGAPRRTHGLVINSRTHARRNGPLLRGDHAGLTPGGRLIGYGAISLHGTGITEPDVARVLALGNLAGIGTRIVSGWLSQRLDLTSWWPVTAMAWSGAVGALALASDHAAVSVAGTLVAFALGWGWSGLAFALFLVACGERPGSTGAALQSGGMLGSALGPLVMSGAVHVSGLTAGWALVALAMVAAGSSVHAEAKTTSDSEFCTLSAVRVRQRCQSAGALRTLPPRKGGSSGVDARMRDG